MRQRRLNITLVLLWSLLAGIQPEKRGSGQALEFDGVDDYVDTGISSLTIPFTLSVWMNPYTINSGDGQYELITNYNASTDDVFFWHSNTAANDGDVGFSLDGIDQIRTDVGNVITVGDWYKMTATVNSSEMKLYINGKLVATGNGGGKTFSSGQNFTIGNRPYDLARGFEGMIDEVQIWNRALTQAEIREYMCQKLTGDEPDLLGYWRFDEGSGNTANDSSPNNNDGTLN